MSQATMWLPRVKAICWLCPFCGAEGLGFMPEAHASGACEVTKTTVVFSPTGYTDGSGI